MSAGENSDRPIPDRLAAASFAAGQAAAYTAAVLPAGIVEIAGIEAVGFVDRRFVYKLAAAVDNWAGDMCWHRHLAQEFAELPPGSLRHDVQRFHRRTDCLC